MELNHIIKIVSYITEVPVSKILSRNRQGDYVQARQIICALAHEFIVQPGKNTLMQIATPLSYRTHANVLHSARTGIRRCETEKRHNRLYIQCREAVEEFIDQEQEKEEMFYLNEIV